MLHFNSQDGPVPKCSFTSTVLPTFVDHDQIPMKKKPFSTISGQPFVRTLSLILPQKDSTSLVQTLVDGVGPLHYAKVYMKLSDVIEGDFYNQYIKSGNILMLSEGRPDIDHLFSLSEDTLRLEVDKPTYERMGLNGVPISNKGRKHVKARYAINVNLQLPSMVRGKKAFERIVWAFKNVLNHTVTWLFYDLKGSTDGSGPIGLHQPKLIKVEPSFDSMVAIKVPEFPGTLQEDDYGTVTELLEWLSLVMSTSPRIASHDGIDSYLSRYRAPSHTSASDVSKPSTQDLHIIGWHGFIPPVFIKDVFLAAMEVSGPTWMGMSATGFEGEVYSFLQDNRHTMTWEYKD